MRMHQVRGGMVIPVSNEEYHILSLIAERGSIDRSTLTERDKELARLMVSKGVLFRKKVNEKIVYVANAIEDVWRD